MTEIASRAQLRMSYARWALVVVPVIVLLGLLSGGVSGSGGDDGWYQALAKPSVTPPGWVFPIAWTTLYILMGLALAMVFDARGNRQRGIAIALFVLHFITNLAGSPTFFGAHQVFLAFLVIVLMWATAIATTFAFARVRKAAAWLLVPYLVWISFAGVLNWSIHEMNPEAGTLAPRGGSTQIDL